VSYIDRHLTTEELSALIDQQALTAHKLIETYQAHIQNCERCQRELDELRQTVMLLSFLPQPPLPHSFLLPVDTPVAAEITRQAEANQNTRSSTIIPLQRRTKLANPIRQTLRISSALVAALGLVFVLSGLVATGTTTNGHNGNASGLSQSTLVTPTTSQTSQGQGPAQPNVAPRGNTTAQAQPPDNTVPPATVNAPPSSATNVVTNTNTWPVLLFFDLNTAAGRIGLGILIFILGMMGVTLFKQRKRVLP
jgi:hypothetical protein